MPGSAVSDTEGEISRLQNAYNRLCKLPERDSAQVRLQKEMTHLEEVNLVEMVTNAVTQMEQYSGYLMFNGETACENSYNKFIQILLNQRLNETWGYYLRDQTQEGTAKGMLKNGRDGAGSVDLALYHGNQQISIIETLKLRSMREGSVEEHIRKVAGYNYANIQTAFQVILADSREPGNLWEKYVRKVKEIMNRTKGNDWHIVQCASKKELEVFRLGIMPETPWILLTVHECRSTQKSFHMYHIMADIAKRAEKEEAADARRRKSSAFREPSTVPRTK